MDRSIDFITRGVADKRGKPFYLQLWSCDVHDGHHPSPESLARFAGKGRSKDDRKFFAVLDELDKELGRLFAAIDKLGIAENTLIVLTGDNGPTVWPSYYKRGVEPLGSTGGDRGRKWSLYEGGIRQPLIVRWKGRVPAGRVNESSIIHFHGCKRFAFQRWKHTRQLERRCALSQMRKRLTLHLYQRPFAS